MMGMHLLWISQIHMICIINNYLYFKLTIHPTFVRVGIPFTTRNCFVLAQDITGSKERTKYNCYTWFIYINGFNFKNECWYYCRSPPSHICPPSLSPVSAFLGPYKWLSMSMGYAHIFFSCFLHFFNLVTLTPLPLTF